MIKFIKKYDLGYVALFLTFCGLILCAAYQVIS